MTHAALVTIGVAWLKRRGCHAVLTERGHKTGEVPDAIGWTRHAVVIEAKVSRADFLADASKPHRADPDSLGRERWYLVPSEMSAVQVLNLSPWGLLEWDGRVCRRRVEAAVLPSSVKSVARERDLVVSELRAYHAQGLTIRVGAERWGRRL